MNIVNVSKLIPEVSDWKEGKVIAREGSVITFQVKIY